jgi:hypothetical protein
MPDPATSAGGLKDVCPALVAGPTSFKFPQYPSPRPTSLNAQHLVNYENKKTLAGLPNKGFRNKRLAMTDFGMENPHYHRR